MQPMSCCFTSSEDPVPLHHGEVWVDQDMEIDLQAISYVAAADGMNLFDFLDRRCQPHDLHTNVFRGAPVDELLH